MNQVRESHEEVITRLLIDPGVVFLMGAIDTGKTSFGIELVDRALRRGISAAFIDSDIGQSTAGPPTTVGLKLCGGMEQVSKSTIAVADELAFVGALTPRGHLLPLVAGTAKLVARARGDGCKLIVVDTTGFVSGIYGQLLKFAKMDLIAPDVVIAFSRGGELEPVVGHAKRFTSAQVSEVGVDDGVAIRSIEERSSYREQRFAAYFATGVSRWRVKPTVFMPALPPEFDLSLLDGIVVGMEDGKGTCAGIGLLEFRESEEALRMVSPVTEGVSGLRLGSIRLELDGRFRGPINLRQLFSTE
ncbi:MAG: hypothetical protein H0U16_10500 [Actinobacteria bacterium]|nr:hypothetical protein [Actinomycetota bacterium]